MDEISTSDVAPAHGSVVIPAHNEAAVIGRLLESLADGDRSDLEVVVVANGCSDLTVEAAKRYSSKLPRLVVLDLADAGKSRALNAGDHCCSAYPRIFVDADIEFSYGAVDSLLAVLRSEAPLVGAPAVHFDDTGASRLVRAFYRVFRVLPYASSGLVGLGVYGLSARGRELFGEFPAVTADDLFVQRLFPVDQRIQSSGSFIVRTPRDLRALLQVRTRVAAGNQEIAAASLVDETTHARTTRSTLGSLWDLVRERPTRLPDVLVYCAVTAASRARSRRFDAGHWHRDDSSRG